MDFSETQEQWCESETELCNLNKISAPLVDIPISFDGLIPKDFSIPTREKLATEQKADTELNQLRKWTKSKQCFSAEELAGLSTRMKSLAQLLDQILIRKGVLVIRRHDDPERELTILPSTQVEHIIRF